MIPQKIQAIFYFIDFLDKNKITYIDKYIPLCKEINDLDKQRFVLKPDENYKDKHSYDIIQKQIKEKFEPITENIHKPIKTKLIELGIWSGDESYASIWNNDYSEISDFKRNFLNEDAQIVFDYKEKYLSFRKETKNNSLYLSMLFSSIDEILKELFDFFKDTKENEFESFETKTIEVHDFSEIVENIKENINKNVKYIVPIENVFGKKSNENSEEIANIKNEINVYDMGVKIKVGDISNNSGQVTLGKGIRTEGSKNDDIAKKSFQWQKRDTIIATIIGIIGLVIAFLSLKN